MNYYFRIVLSTLPIIFCLGTCYAQEVDQEFLRRKTEGIIAGRVMSVEGEILHCKTMLPEFYLERSFQLAWSSNKATQLIKVIGNAEKEGLTSGDYHFSAISEIKELEDLKGEKRANLDILLTDAALLYASHFLNGKINPESVDSQWKAIRREGNARKFLEMAIVSDDLQDEFYGLAPDTKDYDDLRMFLETHIGYEKNGGWGSVPKGETLKPGMVDKKRVEAIADRLQYTGELPEDYEPSGEYDQMISEAVRQFQMRHGLDVDGNTGEKTIAAMNVPVSDRIDQIKINMERYRWITKDLGDHYLIVNIANFRMRVFKDDDLTFEEKVIVGKPFRKTPVFSGKMTYMVVNPTWTVPPTILFNDLIPAVQKDITYLANKNMKVLTNSDGVLTPVDPNTIDWASMSRDYFPYTVRQEPGPDNALGAVKFMFPNPYNIYIHDTPSRELFNRTERIFSSGCIRLNKPMEFAQYLIGNEPGRKEILRKAIETGNEQTIILIEPVTVHIQYLTSWVENGMINFRRDIYERDSDVLKALKSGPPSI